MSLEQPPAKRRKSSSVDDILGIRRGEDLEVKWDIVNDEDLSLEEIWWRAKVLEKTTTTHVLIDGEEKSEEAPVYRIEYDAIPSKGYNEKVEAKIIFVSDESIYHIEDDQLLEFRRQMNASNDSEMIENMIGSLVSRT